MQRKTKVFDNSHVRLKRWSSAYLFFTIHIFHFLCDVSVAAVKFYFSHNMIMCFNTLLFHLIRFYRRRQPIVQTGASLLSEEFLFVSSACLVHHTLLSVHHKDRNNKTLEHKTQPPPALPWPTQSLLAACPVAKATFPGPSDRCLLHCSFHTASQCDVVWRGHVLSRQLVTARASSAAGWPRQRRVGAGREMPSV